MKILVIRFSSIGDIVLTTPILRCIKQQMPEVELHYLTKAAYKPVIEANPYIDKFHFLKDNLNEIIDELQDFRFDYVIDLHRNLRTQRVKRALNTHNLTFSKLNIRKWVLVNFKLNLMPDKSIVERYFDAIKKLNVKNDGQGLDYFIPKTTVVGNKDLPMSHLGGYAGCVIGGSYYTKKLPVEQWRKFCKEVPYPVILLGGPEDRAEGDKIAELDPIKIYNACGKFDLNESAWLVKHAHVVVSNDTGLMHIAAAFKKPLISLWGNTSPEMGMFPYFGYNNISKVISKDSIILENKRLYCHPCSKLGYNKCPEGHFKCMNELNMQNLSDFVKKMWQTPNH
jgi:heptosyltransferase-2